MSEGRSDRDRRGTPEEDPGEARLDQNASTDAENPAERGEPGGGRGRKDEARGSGVHPASAGRAPEDAVIRTPAAWGQGDRGAAGYDDAGQSELFFYESELRAAGAARKGAVPDPAGRRKPADRASRPPLEGSRPRAEGEPAPGDPPGERASARPRPAEPQDETDTREPGDREGGADR